MKRMRTHAGKNEVADGHLDATAQVPQNRSEVRGTGTVFPTKRGVNGLSDLADLHFVTGKMSQSPSCVRRSGSSMKRSPS